MTPDIPLEVNQDREPNYRDDAGLLCIVRCFVCDPERGKENYLLAVASGKCVWCGWPHEENDNG